MENNNGKSRDMRVNNGKSRDICTNCKGKSRDMYCNAMQLNETNESEANDSSERKLESPILQFKENTIRFFSPFFSQV